MLFPLTLGFLGFGILMTDCSRAPPPTILRTSMASATVLRGEDMVFTCIVNHLGNHMVAFFKIDTPTRLLTFDQNVFHHRDKYELRTRVGDSHNEWTLTIKNVQESDRGNYSCQVNTDPIQQISGNLDVKVPPQISRKNPTDYLIVEGDNVTMFCRADGNPKPTVTWRRQDRQIIRYNGANSYGSSVAQGPNLELTKISRKHMSEYICVASNGIPPDDSFTVKLLVSFKPLVQAQAPKVHAALGTIARLVCTSEAWPRPQMIWEKDGEPIYENNNFSMSHTTSGQYYTVHVLEIRHIHKHNFGNYRCLARNDNGFSHSEVELIQSHHHHHHHHHDTTHYLNTNVVPEGSASDVGITVDDEDSSPYDELPPPPPPEYVPKTTNAAGIARRHHETVNLPISRSELRSTNLSSTTSKLFTLCATFLFFYGF